MEGEYPWYKLLENKEQLLQGDLIDNCPIVIPPITRKEKEPIETKITEYNVIILSQLFDLA